MLCLAKICVSRKAKFAEDSTIPQTQFIQIEIVFTYDRDISTELIHYTKKEAAFLQPLSLG